jgi:hypothetical protein
VPDRIFFYRMALERTSVICLVCSDCGDSREVTIRDMSFETPSGTEIRKCRCVSVPRNDVGRVVQYRGTPTQIGAELGRAQDEANRNAASRPAPARTGVRRPEALPSLQSMAAKAVEPPPPPPEPPKPELSDVAQRGALLEYE